MAPRKPLKTLGKAEGCAYSGCNESQDTQEKFTECYLEHGIRVVSSSTGPEQRVPLPGHGAANTHARSSEFWKPDDPRQVRNAPKRSRLLPAEKSKPKASSPVAEPRRSKGSQCPLLTSLNWATKETGANASASDADAPDALVTNDALPPRQAPRATAPLKKRKMDSSQSPTQSNDGRSYSQYQDNDFPSDHPAGEDGHETQSTRGDSPHRTLYEDDTGAVKFNLPAYQNLRADFSQNDGDEDSPESAHHSAITPETPAVGPRLTFQNGEASVLGASQLFAQTQFTSAVKRVSPTSSRPSPFVFNDNTISPNNLESPLGGRGLRTSPSLGVASSPNLLTTSSKPIVDSQDAITVPESPRLGPRKARTIPEPIGSYSGFLNAQKVLEESEDDDFGSDGEIQRRRLAKMRQEEAVRRCASISVARSSSIPRSSSKGPENVHIEVPSTNHETHEKKVTEKKATEDYLKQRCGKYEADKDDSEETEEHAEIVADSQELAVPTPPQPPLLEIQESNTLQLDTPNEKHPVEVAGQLTNDPADPILSTNTTGTSGTKEVIPETSPAGTFNEPAPRLPEHSITPLVASGVARRGLKILAPPASSPRVFEDSDKLAPTQSLPAPSTMHSSPPRQLCASTQPSSKPAGPRRSSRQSSSMRVVTPTAAPSASHAPPSATSTLSALSTTPNMSSSTTPNTEVGHASKMHSSPSVTKAKTCSSASKAVQATAKQSVPDGNETHPPSPASNRMIHRSPLTTYSYRARQRIRRDSSRTTRHRSASTDELAPSPSESSTRSRSSRSFTQKATKQMHEESADTGGIFQGMAFAISFQSKQPHEASEKYNERLEQSKSVQQMILQGGGKVLTGGFSELFEVRSLSSGPSSASVLSGDLKLKRRVMDTGFTALIADGHSRKVKYMQALALGLPCLACKWILTCVAKNSLVDWSSYVLCAGQSKILGDAIRSRNILTYDASSARLAEVITRRPMLLDKTEILLVMKKSRSEDKRMEYVFLAQVLGADLFRVFTVDEARVKLREREDKDNSRPFDWVYVDDHMANVEGIFGAGKDGSGPAQSKKRKRPSTGRSAVHDDGRLPKRIRTLTDELVVQSLILGRMIEDGEMEE
ncbi:uncharacterized protein BCR38DRAFT_418772 [Pseudomassariella vexata]|uniref:BRCT domain-containing protein n=1 Tax=Pseudomassariella vexata TaxID=1141098 RepID=A0A1Y2EKJ8_9PEZI|nr:uncharacterized protein BCR38DRAFT_418772 [Pseudomassariella vexata]ORY72067.1 hypothetical protein BCR38DRAFT_418772 [Pseudomassariella vexata]